MKKSLLLILIFTSCISLFSQSSKNIPNIQIKNLQNEIVNTQELFDGKSWVILSFWATWCKPCIKELDAYNENIIDWSDETGVKLYAISIDNARSMSRVAPFVNGRGWENIEFYLDPNEDFKRAMNVINVPHTLLLDGNGKIIWQHTSYTEGDEYELYDVIKEKSSK
ncbi:MAG: TlpA family protein disulfide reductase [Bacteroidales bacterium]|nr:TlpA family protein disulfide reductase [Bacteroidales bacterium]